MNTDHGVNAVVFEVKVGRRLEKLLGERSARAADGLGKVLGDPAVGVDGHPAAVRRVYCRWEPTPCDRTFLTAMFSPR